VCAGGGSQDTSTKTLLVVNAIFRQLEFRGAGFPYVNGAGFLYVGAGFLYVSREGFLYISQQRTILSEAIPLVALRVSITNLACETILL